MSPSKFHGNDVTKGAINGPRSLPLRINKDSNVIHKPLHRPPTDGKKRPPVIIYTHSPRVIYAQANNFMALVQSLTGSTCPAPAVGDATPLEAALKVEDSYFTEKQQSCDVGYVDNHETTSVPPDEQRFMVDVKQDSSMQVSPTYNTFQMDQAPVFTPNPSEFFCSTSSLFQTPNMAATAFSPSFMDYMKTFPDYL